MKNLTGLIALALLTASSLAQTPAPPTISTPTPEPGATPSPTPPASPKPGGSTVTGRHTSLTYVPPPSRLTDTRTDGKTTGGTRGSGVKLPTVYVLAPNTPGLTTQAQPSLFWYQSGPATTRVELVITEPKRPKPLLKVQAEKVGEGGIHRFPLSKYNVTLKPGVLYKWTIAMVADPANRSQDLIASGTIQRAEPEAELAAALEKAEGPDKAALYASNGFWYDALETVTNEIDAAPKDKALHLQRARLLDQADLKDAAVAERK